MNDWLDDILFGDKNPPKFSEWYSHGGRIPRKIKKRVLGKRIRRRDLRHKLNTLKIGDPIVTMWERREINHGMFCPHCGETKHVGTGNMTSYPEHWEDFKCLRCRRVVARIDNSPFIHVLEYWPNIEYF